MVRNVNDWERAVSMAAGAALMVLGLRRHQRLATSMGMVLVARGAGGFCPLNAALGRRSDRSNTKVALGGPRGIHVYERITINRPAAELYRFWRDFSNLPRFMEHLSSVDVLSPTRSAWTATAPAGTTVTWEARVINEVEGQLIGWQSTDRADVATAGSVRFVPIGDDRTEIIVHLQYEPPAGKFGAAVASMFGEEPSQQIRADLRRLKTLIESEGARPAASAAPGQAPLHT